MSAAVPNWLALVRRTRLNSKACWRQRRIEPWCRQSIEPPDQSAGSRRVRVFWRAARRARASAHTREVAQSAVGANTSRPQARTEQAIGVPSRMAQTRVPGVFRHRIHWRGRRANPHFLPAADSEPGLRAGRFFCQRGMWALPRCGLSALRRSRAAHGRPRTSARIPRPGARSTAWPRGSLNRGSGPRRAGPARGGGPQGRLAGSISGHR